MNSFVTYTVNFLNHFSGICETKLSDLSQQIHRLETTMVLLETKLASIPGLDDVTLAAAPVAATPTATQNSGTVTQPQEQAAAEPMTAAVTQEEEAQKAEPVNSVAKDPRYAKYFRMVQVGVPVPAVQVKMHMEGLDASLIETPNAPAPVATSKEENDSDFDDDNSTSSFSD
ncbi:PREDICTED: WASH complex subunit CCDC53-like isoform X2 [Priapulus caudatus]|nr:PREDICTED: WASH complex subunit CCDC53-like isoform X2 [Priapulus caudatus]XP_014677435.1 PREDICTED: WASH complex subunit CCDC53-like isoform X2 [Priapulus caudatus]